MFDGKIFFPVTGMPMRKIACISRLLALAEPVPFTVAILKAKSLMPLMRLTAAGASDCRRVRNHSANFAMSHAAVGHRSAHSPQCRQMSSSFTITRFVCGSASDT